MAKRRTRHLFFVLLALRVWWSYRKRVPAGRASVG